MRFIYSKWDSNDNKKTGCIEVLNEEEAIEHLYDIFPELLNKNTNGFYDNNGNDEEVKEDIAALYKVNEKISNHLGNDYLENLARNQFGFTVYSYCFHSIDDIIIL